MLLPERAPAPGFLSQPSPIVSLPKVVPSVTGQRHLVTAAQLDHACEPTRRPVTARSRWCRPRRRTCRRGSGRRGRTGAPGRLGSGWSAGGRRRRSRRPARAAAVRRSESRIVAGLDRELGEALGLPGEHLVGHPLEGLAEHREGAVGVARAEVDVGQPALAAAVAPLHREDDEVEGVHWLHLDPAGAATAGGVPDGEALDDHAFVAARERVVGRMPRAAPGSSVTSRGTRCSSGTSRVEGLEPLGCRGRRAGRGRRRGARRRSTA